MAEAQKRASGPSYDIELRSDTPVVLVPGWPKLKAEAEKKWGTSKYNLATNPVEVNFFFVLAELFAHMLYYSIPSRLRKRAKV